MRKSDRLKLAAMAARWTYGTGADGRSASCSAELLKEFPAVVDDYNLFASGFASERIAVGLITILAGDAVAGAGLGKHFITLIKHRQIIAEAIEDWCDENGFSAAAMVDQHADLHALVKDETLYDHFAKAAKSDEKLILFTQLLASVRKA